MTQIEYQTLTSREITKYLANLGAFLRTMIASETAPSYVEPIGQMHAERYWRQIQRAVHNGLAVLAIARTQDNTIVGSVQLHVDTQTHTPHRAEVDQLMVHWGYRRRGIARRLMGHIETHAHRLGSTALVIAAHRDAPAYHLYQSLGYDLAPSELAWAPNPAYTSADPDTSVAFCKLLRSQAA